jgi:ribosomal-protein-alanine N-acetyltransferase
VLARSEVPGAVGLIRWGDQRARAGPWRRGSGVAFLMPAPDGHLPTRDFVCRCMALLAEQGYRQVVTGALSPEEQVGFVQAGFGVQERLHLLVLDKSVQLPPMPEGPRLRRVGRLRHKRVLKVDSAAFPPFWRLDEVGLKEALLATPERRFRAAVGEHGSVLGYAICGAASGRGFVQRLAVAPSEQGRGIGKRLLLDGLAWLRSVGTQQVAVNTQVGNEAALALYKSVGFREDPRGLCVLSANLVGGLGADLKVGS